MIRNLKALGLALFAVFAMSAMVASAAQAFEFTAFNTPAEKHETVNLHGEQTTKFEHKFTAGSGVGSIECETATFTGHDADGTVNANTEAGNTAPLTITPVYKNCKSSTGGEAHVNMGSCDYRFFVKEKVAKDHYTGDTHLVCPTTHVVITVTGGFGTCTITIKPQEGLSKVTYTLPTKLEPATDVEVDAEVTNVKSTTSGGFLACGIGNGEHTSGTYFGKATVRGTNSVGTPLDLTIVP